MWRTSDAFIAIVQRALAATSVPVHIAAGKAAVVMERPAYGGGALDSYYCRSTADLAALARELKPGSVVSFYFDERIRRTTAAWAVRAEVQRIIAVEPDAMVGALASDGFHINSSCVCSLDDLEEQLVDFGASPELFVGVFPARDDDGMRAVTFQVPDEDGVVRPHPH